MNFGLAFSYVFKDKKWFEKILLPSLCSLIPFIGAFIPAGWGLKAAKNVMEGRQEDALPELDFGADLVRGLLAAIITFIYNIPSIIIVGVGAYSIFAIASTTNEPGYTVSILLGICLGFLFIVLSLLLNFMSYVGIANFIGKGEFGAAFRFKEIFAMLKKSFGSWLLVVIGQILTMTFIAPLGAIFFIIGSILTTTYATAVYSHLIGQAYQKTNEPSLMEMEVLE